MLHSDKRRDELEALVWKALQDAQDFMKTEEAAKNARVRVKGMEAVWSGRLIGHKNT
jgi:hypothetical protein